MPIPIPSPDRFVPIRGTPPLGERFRSSKEPHELSTSERLVRTDSFAPDAFISRTRRAEMSVSVGGLAPGGSAIEGGRGRLFSPGTHARLYATSFSNVRPESEKEQEKHEGRLALALKMDRVQRVLDFDSYAKTFPRWSGSSRGRSRIDTTRTTWNGTEWSNDDYIPRAPRDVRALPNAPFRVLDAPGLRDDFYCSIMAYDANCNTLAVGLGNLLYGWSESTGVTLMNAGLGDGSWLTSVAFSSEQGGKSILAFGRSNGRLSLMSLFEHLLPRFETQQAAPVASLSWRPMTTTRGSLNPFSPGTPEVNRHNWPGATTLLAQIKVHSQQVCGLAWSYNGEQFATGGNDNLCCLFDHKTIIDEEVEPTDSRETLACKCVPAGSEKHRWQHGAAVKAIAFCPWREGLIATGGGSNDKCIHFFHTSSGAALATIAVAAQVTSLIWSTTRRELAATFGYAQPDHPYRIAVFSWPDCRQVAAVPWEGDHRALYAIPYPAGPSDTYRTRGRRRSRTAAEGCIVVASSDESVKFHEVWTAGPKATTGLESGVLAGSDILEMGEGIDKEGDIIR
ncbi:hypothetical protein DL764_006541 [Monosporascus ibericus]|uniref:CDC20/Fizzy WD40 domain-containing protein n=1 Tax=Monosporascus ibericus TaxID=155417 RepID=A0A4Q4T7W6_9PEZI|nr:hypothetical protein DL764_006541 [Monosporascus ibericus]